MRSSVAPGGLTLPGELIVSVLLAILEIKENWGPGRDWASDNGVMPNYRAAQTHKMFTRTRFTAPEILITQ